MAQGSPSSPKMMPSSEDGFNEKKVLSEKDRKVASDIMQSFADGSMTLEPGLPKGMLDKDLPGLREDLSKMTTNLSQLCPQVREEISRQIYKDVLDQQKDTRMELARHMMCSLIRQAQRVQDTLLPVVQGRLGVQTVLAKNQADQAMLLTHYPEGFPAPKQQSGEDSADVGPSNPKVLKPS